MAEQKKLSRQNKILEQKIIALQSNETSLESDPRQGQPANALISLNSSNEQSNLQNLTQIRAISIKSAQEPDLSSKTYIKDNKASQALLALENFTPEENNRAEYHSLTGRAYQELKQYKGPARFDCNSFKCRPLQSSKQPWIDQRCTKRYVRSHGRFEQINSGQPNIRSCLHESRRNQSGIEET